MIPDGTTINACAPATAQGALTLGDRIELLANIASAFEEQEAELHRLVEVVEKESLEAGEVLSRVRDDVVRLSSRMNRAGNARFAVEPTISPPEATGPAYRR